MNILDFPAKELITQWDQHLPTFWVPLIVGLIFAGLSVKEISQGHIQLFILYIVLTLGSFGYILCGNEVLSKLTGLFG